MEHEEAQEMTRQWVAHNQKIEEQEKLELLEVKEENSKLASEILKQAQEKRTRTMVCIEQNYSFFLLY